jgi:hypothetical protein
MAALVQALSRVSAGTNEETETLKLVALFCCAGLLVSILFAIYGPAADLTSGFFSGRTDRSRKSRRCG